MSGGDGSMGGEWYRTPQGCTQNTQNMGLFGRVAKCHRYGRYICVKILESWGIKRQHQVVMG